MIILIFGISNVGKTETGKKLAEKLGYSFFDLDDQIKKHFHITLEQFMNENPWLYERCVIKGKILKKIVNDNGDDMVIAVSPIYYARNFNYLLQQEGVIAVELQDTEEIHEDIMCMKRAFKKIQWKYFIDNKSIEQVSEELMMIISDKIESNDE